MINKLTDSNKEQIIKNHSTLTQNIQRLFDMHADYENKLCDAVERRFKREKIKAGGFGPETDILAQDGSANLKRLLIMKADKVDLEKLYEIKSNKIDTDNMLDIQQMMQKQFKHILVLFIELINLHHLKADDTRGSFEKRQQDLIIQVQTLTNWVMKFDPLNYIQSAEQANHSMAQQISHDSILKDFTEHVLKNVKI